MVPGSCLADPWRAMRALAACAFCVPRVIPWLPLRTRSPIVRRCFATGTDDLGGATAAEEEVTAARQRIRSPRVLLRDIFAPKRLVAPMAQDISDWCSNNSSQWSAIEGFGVVGKGAQQQLHRLDRLQKVADLVLEDRGEFGGDKPWGCADIGTDHGLLAICLHANGANVIAGDRAAGPLGVARENTRLYLRRAQKGSESSSPSSNFAGRTREEKEPGAPCSRRFVGLDGADRCGDGGAAAEESERPFQGSGGPVAVPVAAASALPRLECRLGDGLDVLENGEVDTVCIAGVGVKTMIKILSATTGAKSKLNGRQNSSNGEAPSPLSCLGVRRLVLQPMDARLEYMRDLRVWLRKNGWKITQETIVSTLGKGGKHAFLTLRADLLAVDPSGLKNDPGRSYFSGTYFLTDLPVDEQTQQQQSDWLGDFLPTRATDADRLRGAWRQQERREASTFLAYLRHQRDWLRAIERARVPSRSGDNSSSTSQGVAVSEIVESALTAVEEVIRKSGEWFEECEGANDSLVTARRWRRSTGSVRGKHPESIP